MKLALLTFLTLIGFSAFADSPDISIPDQWATLIKTTDYVEVSGTNDLGGAENFTIHNAQAIKQFVQLITSDRFTSAPKSLNPQFKSLSRYKIRLSSRGALLLEFQIIGDSVLDIPKDPSFYMESDRHSDNLMAPLLRLR